MGKKRRTRDRRTNRRGHANPSVTQPSRPFGDHSTTHAAGHHGAAGPDGMPDEAEIESILAAVANPGAGGDRFAVMRLLALDPIQIAPATQRVLLRQLPRAWTQGWQPAEIHRELARHTNRTGAKLAVGLIANDHATREPRTLDPRWIHQLDALELPTPPDADWIVHAVARGGTAANVDTLLEMVSVFGRLRPIPILIPPPGQGTTSTIDLNTPFDSPMLERVRALLAKAESSEFEAEAEAFTAKAHELMARHSIDTATLAARASNPDRPITIRLPIDNPYADAKVLLCQIVAEHCGARAVYQPAFAFSTVVGFAGDVAATELLFTSLLVQAQTALQVASRASAGSSSSTRGFRSSFLSAYANRIAERLDEINANVMAEAESDAGCSLVPVLANRDAAVRAAVEAQFSNLTFKKHRGPSDAAGWTSGRLAADRARLSRGDLPASP